MVLATALLCLAANIYHEARGESLTGQHAVAQVTMNRADRDSKRVCEVVAKPRQFSWTTGLLKRSNGRYVLAAKGSPKDQKAWNLAVNVARVTLAGWTQDFTHGATFYHARSVAPSWRRDYKLVAVIGHHKFYS